jgi:pimeloyl-ACP methyl ester carboxylesterase
MPDLNSRIKVSAGQIFWRETGDNHRPVAIFLHGSWDDSRQWQHIIELLGNNFHCLAIDLLGFGNSTAMTTPGSIAIEVDCLHEFVTALKLRRFYLVGHSLGAWVAVSYALKYPDPVQGVVAISPEGFSLANWQKYSKFTRWLLAHPRLFKLWLSGLDLVTSISDGADLLVKRQKYWSFFNNFPTTCKILFQQSSKDLQSELVANRLRQFRAPFLVLQSDLDSRYTIEQSQFYANAVRKSEYKSIGSLTPLSSAEALLQIVQEIKYFFNRVQLQIDREEVELW